MEDDDMMLGGWYSSFGEDPLMSSPGFPDELRASEEGSGERGAQGVEDGSDDDDCVPIPPLPRALPARATESEEERRRSSAGASTRAPRPAPAASSRTKRCNECKACLNPGWKKPCQVHGSSRPPKTPKNKTEASAKAAPGPAKAKMPPAKGHPAQAGLGPTVTPTVQRTESPPPQTQEIPTPVIDEDGLLVPASASQRPGAPQSTTTTPRPKPSPAATPPRPAGPSRDAATPSTGPGAAPRRTVTPPPAWPAPKATPRAAETGGETEDGGTDDEEDCSDDGGAEYAGEDTPDPHAPTEDNYDDEEANQRRREANIRAMVKGTLVTSRRSVVPKLLQVEEGEAVLRKAFKTPHPTAPNRSEELLRRLAARKAFVPWGGKPFKVKLSVSSGSDGAEETRAEEAPPPAPAQTEQAEENPLILWTPPDGAGGQPVRVDPMLTQFLRPHQREGVQFMFECVVGLRGYGGNGCILADDMGLGKTLQGISLLWTMLTCGHELLGGAPLCRRVIIVCPTSLVSNWEAECDKWLKGRVKCLALSEASRDDAIAAMDRFLSPSLPYHVMVVSYETFRIHAERFRPERACDLLICDEAHRLKNDATLTNKALDALACRRRVLLSGTPLQNHLDEFFAMVSFCNPGVLGTAGEFRKKYEGPILAGREPGASDAEVQLGNERSEELSAFVNQFILRRTNTILSKHLPPKLVSVVCCRMTDMQTMLYRHFLDSKAAKQILTESEEGSKRGAQSAGVLGAITMLKKLCNHPKLIYDVLTSKASQKEDGVKGFKDALDFFPPGIFESGRVGRGPMMQQWEELSGKFGVLARMLDALWTKTRDRIVIVSNYTQTLDLVAQLCRERGYPHVRLDGSTTMNKRRKLVQEFNDPAARQFAFLLSSKAGGCGLNLVGGNRLVLFDPDWNPANDKQAAARVWRDGQRKRVFEYRFLTTGSIEEKVFQRQLSKESLQQAIGQGGGGGGSGESMFSRDELRKLFALRQDTLSDTYEQVVLAKRRGAAPDEAEVSGSDSDDEDVVVEVPGVGKGGQAQERVAPTPVFKSQDGKPAQEELEKWGHHPTVDTVEDEVLRDVAQGAVSFVFTCAVDGKDENLMPHGYASMHAPAPVAVAGSGTAAAPQAGAGAARGRGRGRGGRQWSTGSFRPPGSAQDGAPAASLAPGGSVSGGVGRGGASRSPLLPSRTLSGTVMSRGPPARTPLTPLAGNLPRAAPGGKARGSAGSLRGGRGGAGTVARRGKRPGAGGGAGRGQAAKMRREESEDDEDAMSEESSEGDEGAGSDSEGDTDGSDD